MNNPIEMRNIIREVEGEYMPQDLAQRRKQFMTSTRVKSVKRRGRSSSSSSSESSADERRRRKQQKLRSERS